MSLINEALKRARETQRQQPPPTATNSLPLQPAEGQPAARWFYWLIPLALGLLLLAACWFLWLGWRASSRRATTAGPDVSSAIANAADSVVRQAGGSGQVSPAEAVAFEGTKRTSETNAASTQSPDAPEGEVIAVAETQKKGSQATTNHLPAINASQTSEAFTNVVASSSSTNAPAVAFKVQGIFYRASKASALINGQTLFIGDEIDGAKVIGIDRSAVRLLIEGKTNVLTLR